MPRGEHRPERQQERLQALRRPPGVSLADEMNREISQIVFDLNAQLAAIHSLHNSTVEAGERLLALQSHNQDVMVTGGQLTNVIPQQIEELRNAFHVAIHSLENYLGRR